MTLQRILLRLYSARILGTLGRKLLDRRVWRIEDGGGRGLKLRFPQNLAYIFGSSERPVQQALATHLRPGDSFYDVGANVGFLSLIGCRLVGSSGHVYAFEPLAANAQTLRSNAALNGLNCLNVFEVAVGSVCETADLLMPQWNGGGSLATLGLPPREGVSRTRVLVVTLDDFIAARGLRAPNLVKIDVEGAELDVLRGMRRTIEQARPILLYEVDDEHQASLERRQHELDEHIAGFGYRIAHLENSYPGMHWHVGHSLAVPR